MEQSQEKPGCVSVIRRIIDSDWLRIVLIWIVTMLLRYGLAGILLCVVTGETFAQTNGNTLGPLIPGEVLRYKVKWLLVRLGTVTIHQIPADSGRMLVKMSVQSAKGLPFIDVHFDNQTYVSERSQSLDEETILSGSDPSEKTVYWFDRRTEHIMMVDSLKDKQTRRDSLNWASECYDALGLLMYSRRFAASGTSTSLPTVNDYKIDQTDVSFTKGTEEIEVDAFDAPRRCHLVSGRALWVGKSFAGMKGPFQGWFTDDAAAIPLRAKVGIFLGSIVLELESYERPALTPAIHLVDTSSK